MSATTLGHQILNALGSLNRAEGTTTTTMTGPSAVSQTNPYRSVLESIRQDLYHWDLEKKARIIFTIQDVLENNRPEDAELLAVFQRVLEVVQNYKNEGTILQSPIKKTSDSGRTLKDSPSCARSLFQEINDAIDS